MSGMLEDPRPPVRPTARALARSAVANHVAETAFELFADRGYESTTVDDICIAAGVSRSSFFRYFPSKEQALLRRVIGFGEEMREALEKRPEVETPWTALRRSLDPLLAIYSTDPDRAMRVAQMLTGTQALAVHHATKVASWRDTLGPEVSRRLGNQSDDPRDPRPGALIAATFGYLDAAIAAWAQGDGALPLAAVLDHAMAAIGSDPT